MTEIGKDIQKAKAILEAGGLVAIPTETVYGLAANALNPKAVAKIFEAKNRPSFDPLIIHISTFAELHKYTSQSLGQLTEIANKFWPGPLTVLLPKRDIIPDVVTSGLERVAVRVPQHELTLSLLSSIDFPLAAPSANPFGYVSPTTAQHVYDQLAGKVDYILDGGPCQVGVESTIIGIEDADLVVYRKGGLAIEDLERNFEGKVRVNDFSASNPSAPGMLKKHYSPDKQVLVYKDGESYDKETAFLRFSSPISGYSYQFVLSESADLAEAAARLFQGLRALDQMPVKTIVIEFVPEVGLGRAINDRLRRTIAEE
ncbi:L-threonylcarbamoyladenylate synthase [Leadbetterella byssophila]|uniref:L-threonylcarbamoyladenylate synthase n=1 Tax=Leadbetterella byssophila TaxID=316068 RepID=UPI0039A3DE8B